MPRGDKSAYTDKQKRQAEHIEEGYEDRGVPDKEAERRAWATVNKMTGEERRPPRWYRVGQPQCFGPLGGGEEGCRVAHAGATFGLGPQGRSDAATERARVVVSGGALR